MRFPAVLLVSLALLSAACGQPPAADTGSEPAAPDPQTSSTPPSTATTATATVETTTPTTSTSTTTSTVATSPPADAPDIELFPPLPEDEPIIVTPDGLVGTTEDYFVFTLIAGTTSYTGVHIQTYETEDGANTVSSELRVDGERHYMSTDAEGDLIEVILDRGDDGELWGREVDGSWQPVTDAHLLGWLLAAILNAAGPDGVHEFLYPVFDRLDFVGWDEQDGVSVARYHGDARTVAALFGADEDDVAGDAVVDVWLDPRGFFTAYEVKATDEDVTFTVEWRLSDVGTTVVEVPD